MPTRRYPALPDNEYGWEKLYAKRMAMTFGHHHGFEVRIARFQNCYGPQGTWQGRREKAPAAICRKVAMAKNGGSIEVWGDGTALRPYVYVADLVDAVHALMQSDVREPTNIGRDELTSVRELVDTVIAASGKTIGIEWVDGPVGVTARYHSTERIRSIGWKPRYTLGDGIGETYAWIEGQVERQVQAS